MELAILMIIGILFLVMSLTIWRLRVKQMQDQDDTWASAVHQNAGEPWPWPKSDK
jgi:hypothetical protein